MAETFPEAKQPEENGRSGRKSRIREWFRGFFGKPQEIKKPEEPKKELKSSVYSYKNIREEIPEYKPKMPSEPLEKKLSPPVEKKHPVIGPIAKVEAKQKKIADLSHLDDAALFEKMTGEKPSAEDLAKLRQASPREKEASPEKPKNKGEILKDYPENPQDELDLHGKTAVEAEKEIKLFLLRAKRLSMRMVRIVTGKGLHSEEGRSVLREVADKRVIQLKREGLIFSHKWEKGGGSILVYLP